MYKVGVTGSTGVLGKIFVRKLDEEGIKYNCFKGDIRNRNNIKEWFKEDKFKAVVHFAAIVPTKEVEKDPKKAEEVNVRGTQNLIDELKLSGQNPWFFYASTSHVYRSKNAPLKETDPIEPISKYGETKYDAEKIVSQKYKNACIGRIFSFYHETQKKPFLYPTIKERLRNEDLDRPFELYGANSVRDFLNAEMVVEIILKLMKKKIIGIYNIASGEGTKIRDFVQNLSEKKLKIKEKGKRDYLVANIDKLKRCLGG